MELQVLMRHEEDNLKNEEQAKDDNEKCEDKIGWQFVNSDSFHHTFLSMNNFMTFLVFLIFLV